MRVFLQRLLAHFIIAPLIAGLVVVCLLPLTLAAFGQLGLLGVGGTISASAGLPAITSATTYYVCAKGAGGTCVYNGDAGTTATPSDSNDCLTKGTPCLTIGGVASKVSGLALSAVLTVQLADTAGTGTDCYLPSNVMFNNVIFGTNPLDSWEQANGATLQYPLSYVYVHGDDSAPANVLVTGATTCIGTSASASAGLRFDHTTARVRGINFKYFGAGSQSFTGAMVPVNSTLFVEDVSYTAPSTSATSLINAYSKSYLIFGSSTPGISITNGYVYQMFGFSHAQFITPLGRANFTVADSQTSNTGPGIFNTADNSWTQWDAASLTVTGTATITVWDAIDHSGINWSDASTFTAPSQTISINGSNFTSLQAQRGSYINDLCRTAGSLTCNIGNTTSIAFRAKADTGSFIVYNTIGTDSNLDLATDNSTILSNVGGSSRMLFALHATTFANLASQPNGNIVYCSDCTSPSNPATGTSTGALCFRQNGAWKCF